MVERKRQTGARQTASTESSDESSQDAAAALIIEYERKRKRRARRKARRKRREAEKQHHAAMERMQQSIEVIKWCIVSISAVMVIALLTGLFVLNRVHAEVERIKGEVADIQREAEMIREKIRHPFQTLGGALGSELDDRVGTALGIDRQE